MARMEDFQLKPISYNDLTLVLKWRNSDDIKSFMYTDHHISWEEHYNWFTKVTTNSRYKVWLLHYKDRPLGLINFSDIDREHSRCYWGFYIGENTAPKGSGTVMGILGLDNIFNKTGIYKVCSEAIHTNSGSIQFHRKLGFESEGRFVEHIRKDNQYLDVIPMALFADKWERIKPELIKSYSGEGGNDERD
ncbi:UDP-4-amino-4,6-dideoxy-N-acetyl-beta-L-altrosamine N-acetyltransferase [Virgibacillus sp. C22-A2]|uniref:UDP-4-amino-4, 6-dideoxy-N-acetyl-beta-L-altrosamine N-acetyltransferase n=1 Tax=Virgibacillus tibetensis TaxID=3042313 RepID=A0ABU6KFY5_9BACI|nr:UDP-4-amino-4,6-dideoxy-N-acetyl-beta-L-altrosamine N-acetyltransferase [Virgibacillus sp. C22-A2]